MDDVEYILRIILKARDEMATVLQKARREIRAFAKDSDTMNTAVTNLNQAMKNFDGNMDNITKKMQAWRAIIRDAGDDTDKSTKSLDSFAKSAERNVKATQKAAESQKALQLRARALRDEVRAVNKAHEDGAISTKTATSEYNRLGKELDKITLRMSDAARSKTPADKWAREADAAAAAIKKANDDVVESKRKAAAAERQVNQEKARDDRKAATQADREAAAAKKRAEDAIALQERIERVNRRAAVVRERLQRGGRDRGDLAELRRIASEQDSIAKAYQLGSQEARHFNMEAERSRTILRDVSRQSDSTGRSTKKLSEHFHSVGTSVAGFDNQLRGLGMLAAVVSIQQLISAAVALGGELVSLAGSAVMAGGALGGVLAAGAAQALPVMGLLAGAVSRVKNVAEAFQQSQLLQKAAFTDNEKGAQKAIDKTAQLANASDAAAAANDTLAESRKNLTDAQKAGTEQLEDLIYAEKQASLAAKGAALDVRAAQEALRLAVQGGASQLEIDQKRQALAEARLSQTQAGRGARKATAARAEVGGDISKLPDVQAAQKAMENAQRSVDRTNRALDVAADKTDRLAASTMTAQANLDFMLSQMAPAERRLYTAFQGLYENYKKIFSGTSKDDGIYGAIIDGFTRAVEEANKIIQMPKVIASLTRLSGVIGDNIDKVVKAVADPTVMNQLLAITDAASENLGPVVDILIDLGKAFLNIAETANPAFQKLLDYIGPIVDKFLALTDDKGKMEDFFNSGEEHLESWLDLVFAIIGLFAALTGASADEGQKSIDDLTKKIKGWTDWIDDHHDQVVGFFEDARKAAYAIGGVLENLAGTLFKSFSADRVENFAKVLNDTVIPALAGVIDTVGRVVDKVIAFADTPVGGQIVKWAIAFLLLQKVVGGAVGVLGMFTNGIGTMLKMGEGAVKFFKNFGGYVDNVVKALAGGLKAVKSFYAMLRVTAIFLETHAPLMGRAMTLALGPWGLVIAAVIVGVLLLLKHFGKLGEIWDAIKEAAAGFMKDIEPAVKALQEALEGLGIHIDGLKDVLKFLEKGGKILADFIATYLIGMIQGLFKVLAGVATFLIRTLAGLIKIIHGVADILIGLFTLDGDQIKKGFKEIVDGVVDIFWGIVDGLKLVFEGMVKIWLAPFKAAWNAVKGFFGVKSPSKLAKDLGHSIIEGIKDGLVGLARWLTAPWRRAWNAINDFFDGKPKRLAEKIMDEFVDRVKVLWRRVRAAASYLWEKFKDGFDAAKHFGGVIVKAIVDGVKELPGALLEAIKSIGSALVDVGKSIGGFIVDGIKAAIKGIKDLLPDWLPGGGGDDKDKPKGGGAAPKPQGPAAPTVKFDIGVGAIPFGAKDLKEAENMYGDFWKELRRDARTSTDYIQRQFREMRIATTNSSEKMYEDIRGSLRDIQNSFKVRGAAASRNWEKTWLDFQKVAYDGLNYIGHQTNQALKGFGAKSINFGLSVPTGGGKGGEAKAIGGWIGNQGERGSDNVHAILGRGEAVLNWAHQRVVEPALNAMYGFGLEGLFGHTRALHSVPATNGKGFAAGGATDTRLSRLIAAANRVDAMHLPYVWGGGHQQPAQIGGGMDCSGSVSYVVQQAGYKVPTVTSGNMPSWGFKPGSDGATVFYNPEHTFMRIGQKYFGTTGFGHPGWTGAGWFTQAPSQSYLDGFSKIHLPGITDVGNFAVGVGGEIAKLLVKGSKGAAKTLMQKAFDLVVPAANKFIGEQSSQFDAGPGQWGDSKTVAAGAENIFKFFRSHGFTDEQSAGWIGNLTQESGLNPGIIQPGGEGHGLAQWGHGRFDALVKFAKDHGSGDWRDLGTQLNFILYELAGSERAAGAAIKAARTVQQAVDAIGLQYERFGIAGNRSAPAEAAFRRFGGKFAEGGIIPGGEGEPMPILGHAGEWVLNKAQQGKIANWIGTSIGSVKDMLGFTGGPVAFQGGGEIGRARPTVKSVTKLAERGLNYDDMLESVSKALDDVKRVMTGINKLSPKLKGIGNVIDVATREGGLLDNLRAAIERRFAAANRRLADRQFRVGAGRVVRRAQNDVEVAEGALGQRRAERGDLTDERRQIKAEFDAVAARAKRAKRGSKAAKDLAARQVELQSRLTDADDRVIQNEEDIYNAQEDLARAQEEAAQARKDAFQKTVDDLKDAFTKRGNIAERAKRIATALGDPKLLDAATDAVQNNLTDNINQLSERLNAARAAGYTDIAAGLEEDIAELNTQVVELAQQRLRDAMDVISTAATRRGAVLDLFGRMADAMGLVGNAAQAVIPGVGGVGGLGAMSRGQVAQGRIDSARQEQAGYVGLLGQAQAAGNVGLVQELTDKINELTVSIVEQTKAERDARFAASNEAFDFNTSMNGLQTQLIEATDAATGQTSSAELLRLAQEKLALYSARTLELQSQLQEAMLAGDVKATQDLQKALLENQIAVQQNTKAVNEITNAGTAPASYSSTAWQWFRTAFLTGTGGVMPQYTPPVMADVGSIGPAGTSTTTNNGATIVNNFEINEAGQPIDTTQLANTVVFAQSTAQ
jgi:hypothetical protein